uniref:Uncharacterized protein n=1 Tax=Triticum urartu TaxID=4572 RepID=A0A8R7Q5T7_TRIUA
MAYLGWSTCRQCFGKLSAAARLKASGVTGTDARRCTGGVYLSQLHSSLVPYFHLVESSQLLFSSNSAAAESICPSIVIVVGRSVLVLGPGWMAIDSLVLRVRQGLLRLPGMAVSGRGGGPWWLDVACGPCITFCFFIFPMNPTITPPTLSPRKSASNPMDS